VARRRGSSDDDGGGGAPAWMVTYGDMMSLLLTFFVLLLSFSTIHEEEFKKAMASLQGALGVLEFNRTVIQVPTATPEIPRPRPVRQVAARLARYIKVHGLSANMKVRRVAGGFKITMQNPALFETGRAELTEEARRILTDVSVMLNDLADFDIQIEGHTDNVPIHTEEFPSNLELSAGRSLAVARFFIDRQGFDSTRISVAGHGENKPVASNATADGRGKNRRVEINVLEQAIPELPVSESGLAGRNEVVQYGS